jgi:hypothetical protein
MRAVIEIVSPGKQNDLQIPNLLAYIVLLQGAPKAWVYLRAGAQFTRGPMWSAG